MPSITLEQQNQIVGTAGVGCPLETAAAIAGVTQHELRQAMESDANFARRVERAEATAELAHMKNLKVASDSDKNWRASVWWLEHCLPERYARRVPATVSQDQCLALLQELVELVHAEVHDAGDRERLLSKFARMTQNVSEEGAAHEIEENQPAVEGYDEPHPGVIP